MPSTHSFQRHFIIQLSTLASSPAHYSSDSFNLTLHHAEAILMGDRGIQYSTPSDIVFRLFNPALARKHMAYHYRLALTGC